MGEAIYADLCSSLHVRRETSVMSFWRETVQNVYLYIPLPFFLSCVQVCVLSCISCGLLSCVCVCSDGGCGLSWGRDLWNGLKCFFLYTVRFSSKQTWLDVTSCRSPIKWINDYLWPLAIGVKRFCFVERAELFDSLGNKRICFLELLS